MSETKTPDAEPATDSKRLLKDAEVARKLGVSKRHVHRMRDAGTLPPPLKLGAAIRWDSETLERWIDGGCQPVNSRGAVR